MIRKAVNVSANALLEGRSAMYAQKASTTCRATFNTAVFLVNVIPEVPLAHPVIRSLDNVVVGPELKVSVVANR